MSDQPLGRNGIARRERLLEELRPVVARRGRRRRAIRTVAWASAPVIALLALLVAHQPGPSPAPAPTSPVHQVVERPKPPAAAPRPSVVVVHVATDPFIVSAVSIATVRADSMNDEELVAALRDAGQDEGVVRIDGRLVLAGRFGP